MKELVTCTSASSKRQVINVRNEICHKGLNKRALIKISQSPCNFDILMLTD